MAKYIYGLIEKPAMLSLNITGIDNQPVYVLVDKTNSLSAIISDTKTQKFSLTPKYIMAHYQVIQEALDIYHSILPVRFGTVAPDEKTIKRNILEKNKDNLLEAFQKIKGKVEINLQAKWNNIAIPLKNISLNHPRLIQYKKEIDRGNINTLDMVAIGKEVKADLDHKKEEIKISLVKELEDLAEEIQENNLPEETMIFNLSLLIKRKNENELLKKLKIIDKKYTKERIKIIYSPPLPAYSFVNLSLSLNN